MDTDDVEQYVEQSTSVLESGTGLDELTTRSKLIDPLIPLLGWNLYSPEVELEYRVQMMSSTDKQVDYALILDNDPEVYIEAKAGQSDITESHIGQLGDYMQKEWVDLGLITNGRQFTALKLEPADGGPPEIIELGTVEVAELTENQWILDLFSRDSIQSGGSEEIAENIVKRKEALRHLRNNREAISEEVAEVVTRELDEGIYQESTELAKEFIDNFIDTIDRGEPVATGGSSPPRKKKKHDKADLTRPSDRIEQTIARSDIPGEASDSVAVVPANVERGLDFLFRNQAWGFVQIGQNPEFIAFYISGGKGRSAVWYIGRVADVVSIDEANLEDDPAELIDLSDPKERLKKVIEIEPGSLYELEDPIPYAKKYPQSLRYTTLEKIRTAETTEDLF